MRSHEPPLSCSTTPAHLKHLLPLHPEVLQQHRLRRAAQVANQLHVRHVHLLLGGQSRRLLRQPGTGAASNAADNVSQLRRVAPSSTCRAAQGGVRMWAVTGFLGKARCSSAAVRTTPTCYDGTGMPDNTHASRQAGRDRGPWGQALPTCCLLANLPSSTGQLAGEGGVCLVTVASGGRNALLAALQLLHSASQLLTRFLAAGDNACSTLAGKGRDGLQSRRRHKNTWCCLVCCSAGKQPRQPCIVNQTRPNSTCGCEADSSGSPWSGSPTCQPCCWRACCAQLPDAAPC